MPKKGGGALLRRAGKDITQAALPRFSHYLLDQFGRDALPLKSR
jgi:hypothetical protein